MKACEAKMLSTSASIVRLHDVFKQIEIAAIQGMTRIKLEDVKLNMFDVEQLRELGYIISYLPKGCFGIDWS